jgi:hypothetical protein
MTIVLVIDIVSYLCMQFCSQGTRTAVFIFRSSLYTSNPTLSPQPTLNANPPPASSPSLPLNIPLKSTSPLRPGASPLTGAFGLGARLLLSCPAFDGNVGNRLVGFGRGSSVKYSCSSISFAVGRREGFSARSELSSAAPALVSVGKRDLIMEPRVEVPEGRRRERALGRRLKSGQLVSVGVPQRSKICYVRQHKGHATRIILSSLSRLGMPLT